MVRYNDTDNFHEWLDHIELEYDACEPGCVWARDNISFDATVDRGFTIIKNSTTFKLSWLLWLIVVVNETMSNKQQNEFINKSLEYPNSQQRLEKQKFRKLSDKHAHAIKRRLPIKERV